MIASLATFVIVIGACWWHAGGRATAAADATAGADATVTAAGATAVPSIAVPDRLAGQRAHGPPVVAETNRPH